MLEYVAHGRSHGYPDLAQVLGCTRVFDVLRSLAAHGRERTIECAHHIGNGDIRRLAVEPVAALGAALAGDDAGLAQLTQDSLEELDRDLLRRSDLLALDQLRGINSVGACQLAERAHPVIGFRGNVHSRILARSATPLLGDPPHSPQNLGE